MTTVFRIQHAVDGRGPYRPGFSHVWADTEGRRPPPTWIEEFGLEILDKQREGEAFGCGFLNIAQAALWFTETELDRLRLLDYALVSLDGCRIIARSVNQVVFARKLPFNLSAKVVILERTK